MDQNEQRSQSTSQQGTQPVEPTRVVKQTVQVNNEGKALTITGMVLGIASIVLFLVPVLGFLLGIAGLVLGIIALRKKFYGRGMAIAAMITGAIGVLLGLITVGIIISLVIIGQNAAQHSRRYSDDMSSRYDHRKALQQQEEKKQAKMQKAREEYIKLTPGTSTRAQADTAMGTSGMSARVKVGSQEYDTVRGYTVGSDTYYLYFKGNTLVKKQTAAEYEAEQSLK